MAKRNSTVPTQLCYRATIRQCWYITIGDHRAKNAPVYSCWANRDLDLPFVPQKGMLLDLDSRSLNDYEADDPIEVADVDWYHQLQLFVIEVDDHEFFWELSPNTRLSVGVLRGSFPGWKFEKLCLEPQLQEVKKQKRGRKKSSATNGTAKPPLGTDGAFHAS